MVTQIIKRGDIILVNFDPIIGKEQRRTKPSIVMQNNISNIYSPTTIIAPITSKIYSKEFPTNVQISSTNSGLEKESTILLNQIRAIDKSRVIKRISSLKDTEMRKVDLAIKVSLGLQN